MSSAKKNSNKNGHNNRGKSSNQKKSKADILFNNSSGQQVSNLDKVETIHSNEKNEKKFNTILDKLIHDMKFEENDTSVKNMDEQFDSPSKLHSGKGQSNLMNMIARLRKENEELKTQNFQQTQLIQTYLEQREKKQNDFDGKIELLLQNQTKIEAQQREYFVQSAKQEVKGE